MKSLSILIIISILCVSCQKEERADDFSLTYEENYTPFIMKFETGTITNTSSFPADKIRLRINKYSYFGFFPNSEIISIKNGLDPNQQKEFCYHLADSITKVSIDVIKVE